MKEGKNIMLKINAVSKQYRLGNVGLGTLSHDINRWWYKIRGKENPYLKVGQTSSRAKEAYGDYVWALRDISFEVQKGEVIGIIGKNGAGKSTLLKILSKITSPTTGNIEVSGKMASLLEVGTGFHPEMTGRENIYLNGAILGMTKKEINSKIDGIIDFSGCKQYIDTPVKRYSSGMTVRLAFAVAAFLEPDILIVDEVLAVGDIEFQKKALGKMKEISSGDKRTILFVSHDLSAISTLCNRVIVLSEGKIIANEKTSKAIAIYSSSENKAHIYKSNLDSHEVNPFISKVEIITSEGGALQANGKSMMVDFDVHMPIKDYENIAISFQVCNHFGKAIIFEYIFDNVTHICRNKGNNTLQFTFENLSLYKGQYYLKVHLANSKTREKFQEFDCCSFQVEMIDKKEPEWGWQDNVCQYTESGQWLLK